MMIQSVGDDAAEEARGPLLDDGAPVVGKESREDLVSRWNPVRNSRRCTRKLPRPLSMVTMTAPSIL
jgi:hypothetical protein